MKSYKERVASRNERDDWVIAQYDIAIDGLELGEKVACRGCQAVIGKNKRGIIYGMSAAGLGRNCRRFGPGRFRSYVETFIRRKDCLLYVPQDEVRVRARPIIRDEDELNF